MSETAVQVPPVHRILQLPEDRCFDRRTRHRGGTVGGKRHTHRACFDDFNIGLLPAASGRKVVLSEHTAARFEHSMIAEEAVRSMEREAKLRPLTGGLVV